MFEEILFEKVLFEGFPCQFYMDFSFYYMYLHKNSLEAKCHCPILTGVHHFWALLSGCLMKVFSKSNHSNFNCLSL